MKKAKTVSKLEQINRFLDSEETKKITILGGGFTKYIKISNETLQSQIKKFLIEILKK